MHLLDHFQNTRKFDVWGSPIGPKGSIGIPMGPLWPIGDYIPRSEAATEANTIARATDRRLTKKHKALNHD